ncbi:hypothetical protein [Sodalis glossinidius]|uniref:hypothetical protein n=1 Tax=Sodalis glossinidius TaxID=63612 RepID=UPI001305419D|nr:hypothetical protein [Sodalis glossinidius]
MQEVLHHLAQQPGDTDKFRWAIGCLGFISIITQIGTVAAQPERSSAFTGGRTKSRQPTANRGSYGNATVDAAGPGPWAKRGMTGMRGLTGDGLPAALAAEETLSDATNQLKHAFADPPPEKIAPRTQKNTARYKRQQGTDHQLRHAANRHHKARIEPLQLHSDEPACRDLDGPPSRVPDALKPLFFTAGAYADLPACHDSDPPHSSSPATGEHHFATSGTTTPYLPLPVESVVATSTALTSCYISQNKHICRVTKAGFWILSGYSMYWLYNYVSTGWRGVPASPPHAADLPHYSPNAIETTPAVVRSPATEAAPAAQKRRQPKPAAVALPQASTAARAGSSSLPAPGLPTRPIDGEAPMLE